MDRCGNVLGLRAGRRNAHGDELADIADLVGCERRLIGNLETAQTRDRADRLDAVEIAGRENGALVHVRDAIPRMRACASGLRTKATSFMPAKRRSATNWPRPRISRSSSLRRRRAPTPCSGHSDLLRSDQCTMPRTRRGHDVPATVRHLRFYDPNLSTISIATAEPPSRLQPRRRCGCFADRRGAPRHARIGQQVDVQLDGVAAIDDVGDVDGDTFVVDHDAAAFGDRRAETDMQKVGRELGPRCR